LVVTYGKRIQMDYRKRYRRVELRGDLVECILLMRRGIMHYG
jgi:hypothetical protein